MSKINILDSVCYVAPDVPVPGPRGSSVHVFELSKSLMKIGYKVHVVARRNSKRDLETEYVQGVTIHRIYRRMSVGEKKDGSGGKPTAISRIYYLYLRTIFTIYAAFKVVAIVRHYRIGSILERETAFGAGAIASAITRRPLVLEIVGPRYSRLSVRTSRKILYYTETMLRAWVPISKCVKVPAGVDTEFFKPDETYRKGVRDRLGIRPEDFVFGYIGTFQKWHGLETLLQATKALRESVPHMKVLLVGPDYFHYGSLSKAMGLSEVCIFPGPVPHEDVPRYINACDVMVALYDPTKEPLRKKYGIGFPIKILEYIACGKPVISTKIEIITELAKGAEGVVLTESGDIKQLTSVMEEMLLHKKDYRANADAALNYSWDELGRTVSECLSTRVS